MRFWWLMLICLALGACAAPRPRPLGDSVVSAVGPEAFGGYRDYLKEVTNRANAAWDRILKGKTLPPPNTHVTVKFRLNSKGEVEEIVSVDGNAGELGTQAALDAISSPAPYPPWTKEMIATLGNDQLVEFKFNYW